MRKVYEENPDSPIAPSPEALNPVLEKKMFESSTYRFRIAVFIYFFVV